VVVFALAARGGDVAIPRELIRAAASGRRMQGRRYLQGDVWQVIGSVLRADDLRVIPPLKNAAALRL
jgi:hypothetical protein